MKKQELINLHQTLDSIAVLQHFIDSESGSLFIGMKGVENQIVINKELDLKVRILLGIQVGKMEEEMKAAGIDMTPETPEPAKPPETPEPAKPPETPPEGAIDATASESGEESKEPAAAEEGPGADEKGSSE